MKKKLIIIVAVAAILGLAGCQSSTTSDAPVTTPTSEPTVTAMPEPTASEAPEPTATATPAPEPTATPTPEPTATATPTPEPTATPTPEPTATPTPEPTVTPTPEPTATPTPAPTSTPKPTPTPKPPVTVTKDTFMQAKADTSTEIVNMLYFESQEGLPSGIIQYADGTEEMHTAFPDDEYIYYYVIYPDGRDAGGSYNAIFSDCDPMDYVEFKAEKIEKASGCYENYFGETFYVMPEAKHLDSYQYQDAGFMSIAYVVMDASNKFFYEIDGTPVYEQMEYANEQGEVTQYEEITGYEPGEIGLEVEKRLKDTGEKLLYIFVSLEPDENYVTKAYRLYYYITGGREAAVSEFVEEEIEALRNSLKQ